MIQPLSQEVQSSTDFKLTDILLVEAREWFQLIGRVSITPRQSLPAPDNAPAVHHAASRHHIKSRHSQCEAVGLFH